MLPFSTIDVIEYLDSRGRSPFGRWFSALNARAAANVTIALTRMRQGNLGDVKGVGAGVFERKIDFGPGYRIYFGKDTEKILVLLGGGTKARQQYDIETAREFWFDYKRRK